MTARLHEALQGEVPAPVRLRREARQAAWDASRAGFPARPDQAEWLATRLGHDAVLGLITRPPFTASNPGTRNGQIRGVNLALDWLVSHPGGTWQKRWLASGAEDTGKDWKQDCAAWMDTRGVRARQRMDLLSVGLILGICAGIVRPGLHWLAASGVSPCALGRNLERTRDQSGLSRLRAVLGDGTVAAGARHATIGRAAIIMAAKGGTLAEIAAGDFLELLDAERAARGRPRDYSAVSWRLMRQAGAFGQRAPESLAQLLTIGQRLASRHTLVSVRAFYLDLACWAAGGPRPLGPVGRSQPGLQGRHRKPQGRQEAQVPDGQPHPRAPAGPAGPDPLGRRPPRPHGPDADGRAGRPARRDVHRRRAVLHPGRAPQGRHQDPGAQQRRQSARPDPGRRPRVLDPGDHRGAPRHRNLLQGCKPGHTGCLPGFTRSVIDQLRVVAPQVWCTDGSWHVTGGVSWR